MFVLSCPAFVSDDTSKALNFHFNVLPSLQPFVVFVCFVLWHQILVRTDSLGQFGEWQVPDEHGCQLVLDGITEYFVVLGNVRNVKTLQYLRNCQNVEFSENQFRFQFAHVLEIQIAF